MLSHELRQDEGILVVKPDGPLEASDFSTLASHTDAYLEKHGHLRGVLVRAKDTFPGWKDFGALVAHLKFIKHHHQAIEKVAVIADGAFATVMPYIASQFIHADVRHFDHNAETAAWQWLRQDSRVQLRAAA